MTVRPCGVSAPAGHLLLLFTNAVTFDVTVKPDPGIRFKIPCLPHHFAVLTNDQAKMRTLIVFDDDIFKLCHHCFRLCSGEGVIW